MASTVPCLPRVQLHWPWRHVQKPGSDSSRDWHSPLLNGDRIRVQREREPSWGTVEGATICSACGLQAWQWRCEHCHSGFRQSYPSYQIDNECPVEPADCPDKSRFDRRCVVGKREAHRRDTWKVGFDKKKNETK